MIVNYIAHIIKIEDSHIKELINKGKRHQMRKNAF